MYSTEELTLRHMEFIDNHTVGTNSSGGALFHSLGLLTIEDSTFAGNETLGLTTEGGAIYVTQAHAEIVRSIVSGNAADSGDGGGVFIASSATLELIDSTIANNSSGSEGGGIYSAGDVTIVQSTISSNTSGAGAGVYVTGPTIGGFRTLDISYSTITENIATFASPGGVQFDGPDGSLSHTVIAGNYLNENPSDRRGTFIDLGFNIIGGDPLLSPLGNYGGTVPVHFPLAGSPVIDAGDPSVLAPPANDQRGVPFGRISDGDGDTTSQIDIGAVERQPLVSVVPSPLVVTTLNDEIDNFELDDLSLREALTIAESNPGIDTITFDDSLAGQTLNLTLGPIVVADNVVLQGPGADRLTISGADASRVFHVTGSQPADFDIEIAGITIANGDATSGGGIHSDQNLTLTNVVVRDNRAGGDGGGLYQVGGILNVLGSTFLDNHSDAGGVADGGGIYLNGATTEIVSSTLSGNTAIDSGGAIYSQGGGTLTIKHSTITNNIADANGDGIASGDGGGGMSVNGTTTLIENSIVAGNDVLTNFSVDIEGAVTVFRTLVGNNRGATLTNAGGSIIGTNSSPVDPQLAPIADNGGPTPTHALLPTSPAIDLGDPSFVAPPDFDRAAHRFCASSMATAMARRCWIWAPLSCPGFPT